jgi:8-oxo-dGTP diphosphatase
MSGPVRAAGGLVVRDDNVLLVHRPRFDDWSLPKGKVKRGEHPLAAAVREVHEETAVVGVPGARLPTASYEVWAGDALVEKLVDYWLMTIGDIESFIAGDEVDEIAWRTVPEALGTLTYPRDVRVVRAFSELPPLTAPVVLLRPLDQRSTQRAADLAALLALLRPGRVVVADTKRDRPTVEPLADALGLEIEVDGSLDGAGELAATAVRDLVGLAAVVVVCERLAVISPLLTRAARSLSSEAGDVQWAGPGDALVLSFAADALAAVDPLALGMS